MTRKEQSSALTDEQIVERLATEVMGWKLRNEPEHKKWYKHMVESGRKKDLWNPLTDWNDWRMVEEKIIEDEKLSEAFYMFLKSTKTPEKMKGKAYWNLFAHDLR